MTEGEINFCSDCLRELQCRVREQIRIGQPGEVELTLDSSEILALTYLFDALADEGLTLTTNATFTQLPNPESAAVKGRHFQLKFKRIER